MSRTNTITKYGLANFKAFRYLDDTEIRPLTVLVGANSTGKSSLMQSLLLLKQTVKADGFHGTLKFDGEWTNLGSFTTAVSDFDARRKLQFRLSTEFEATPSQAYYFAIPHRRDITDSSYTIPVTIVIECGYDKRTKSTVLSHLSIAGGVRGVTTDHYDSIVIDRIAGSGEHTHKYFVKRGFGPDANGFARIEKFLPVALTDGTANYQVYSALTLGTGLIDYAITNIQGLLASQVEYLGPLRASPSATYPFVETFGIDTRGVDTVPYLGRMRSESVRYAASPDGPIVGEHTLLEATNHWLRRMKLTDHLAISAVEPIAYFAKIQSPSTPRNVDLAQVGFGVSQLLPVLVMGLKNPSNGTLLLEQPEIHLHPRLQGDLAEFLLCCARAGKTIIVETHSDHLINRLRRCIAEDESGTLADLVSILFIHAGTEDIPGSYAEPLEIDNSGSVVNWPLDFLSESSDEALAILRASQRKSLALKQ